MKKILFILALLCLIESSVPNPAFAQDPEPKIEIVASAAIDPSMVKVGQERFEIMKAGSPGWAFTPMPSAPTGGGLTLHLVRYSFEGLPGDRLKPAQEEMVFYLRLQEHLHQCGYRPALASELFSIGDEFRKHSRGRIIALGTIIQMPGFERRMATFCTYQEGSEGVPLSDGLYAGTCYAEALSRQELELVVVRIPDASSGQETSSEE